MMVSCPHHDCFHKPLPKFIGIFAFIAAVLALQFVQQLDDIGTEADHLEQ